MLPKTLFSTSVKNRLNMVLRFPTPFGLNRNGCWLSRRSRALPSHKVVHSNPPPQGAALAHLDSLPTQDLVIWTDNSVSFPFGKSGSGVLANCSLCGTEATLFFSGGPVCSSFSTKACKLFAGLGSTNKSATSL